MSEYALTENERQLALAAWDYDTYARQWGNLVLEAYDALAARVQELERQVHDLDEAETRESNANQVLRSLLRAKEEMT